MKWRSVLCDICTQVIFTWIHCKVLVSWYLDALPFYSKTRLGKDSPQTSLIHLKWFAFIEKKDRNHTQHLLFQDWHVSLKGLPYSSPCWTSWKKPYQTQLSQRALDTVSTSTITKFMMTPSEVDEPHDYSVSYKRSQSFNLETLLFGARRRSLRFQWWHDQAYVWNKCRQTSSEKSFAHYL